MCAELQCAVAGVACQLGSTLVGSTKLRIYAWDPWCRHEKRQQKWYMTLSVEAITCGDYNLQSLGLEGMKEQKAGTSELNHASNQSFLFTTGDRFG